MNYVTLWLSSGNKIRVGYYDKDFESIYEDWEKGEVMAFQNCCVRGKDVIAIEYIGEGSE
jgi:hypothetical protein